MKCKWCKIEFSAGLPQVDKCLDCLVIRQWMEKVPPVSLKVAAKMLSHLFTLHNHERGRRIDGRSKENI